MALWSFRFMRRRRLAAALHSRQNEEKRDRVQANEYLKQIAEGRSPTAAFGGRRWDDSVAIYRARRAARDAVDAACHHETMARLNLESLRLEQRLAGTDGTVESNQALADYITKVIVPSIDAYVRALSS